MDVVMRRGNAESRRVPRVQAWESRSRRQLSETGRAYDELELRMNLISGPFSLLWKTAAAAHKSLPSVASRRQHIGLLTGSGPGPLPGSAELYSIRNSGVYKEAHQGCGAHKAR